MREGLATALGRYGGLLAGVALLACVYLLPPDTSLAQLRRGGTLTACLPPPPRPPFVTDDPERPGLEVELLAAIAAELGLRLSVNRIAAMGRDFDPSRWRITRAQCAVIGGGLADSRITRSFLDVTPPYLETGLVALSPEPAALPGSRAVVLSTLQGVDRLALSGFLRAQGVAVRLVRDEAGLLAALREGSADIAILDSFGGRRLAAGEGLAVQDLPPPFAAQPLVFGLWKGDLTLKRAVAGALAKMRRDGRLAALQEKYL